MSGYPVNESIMTIINFNFAMGTHLILQDYGCLQKQSIHGLGKWSAKFRTGKVCLGITFSIGRNQLH